LCLTTIETQLRTQLIGSLSSPLMILSMIAVCLKSGSLSENKKMVASNQLPVKVFIKT
jgi:hypothetical protein